MGQIIDGKAVSAKVKEEIRLETEKLKEQGIEIGLAVVIVGDDPASQVYVRNKEKACETVGFNSFKYALPAETTEEELLNVVKELNEDKNVNGILVQLPLPKHIDESKVLLTIDSTKDVDGFHPQSVGAMTIGEPGFLSCTPAGIIQLLKRSNIEIEGKHCVVIGRSNIVGKPMALLMLRENATVTIAHSKTKNLKELCKQADDDGQGGLWFEIAKERISIRLTAPYSQERREVASKLAKENNICAIITSTLVVSILNAQLTIFFMIASLVQIPKCVVVLCEYVIHVV